MNMYALDHYQSVISWVLTLTNKTAMRIGGGRLGLDPTEPDNSVLKCDGKPYIPGSSLKGVLRSCIEAVFREEKTECFVCGKEKFRPTKTNREQFLKELDQTGFKLCPSCAIFGNEFIQGRLFLSDFYLKNEAEITIRDGVRIDRETETAANQAKYDYEIVEPGAIFSGEFVLINIQRQNKEYKALKQMLDWVNLGIIRIGGSTSRGLGRFEASLVEEKFLLEAIPDVR